MPRYTKEYKLLIGCQCVCFCVSVKIAWSVNSSRQCYKGAALPISSADTSVLFSLGLDKGEAPPPPPPASKPRTPSEREKVESVNLDIQGLNISEVNSNQGYSIVIGT